MEILTVNTYDDAIAGLCANKNLTVLFIGGDFKVRKIVKKNQNF